MTAENLAKALGGHRTGAAARPFGVPAGVIKYGHHSASSTSLFCASTAMWVVETIPGLRQPVGAPAHRGVGVDDDATQGLISPDTSWAECIKTFIKYDTLAAFSPNARREQYRETGSRLAPPDTGSLCTNSLRNEGAHRGEARLDHNHP